ncbi:2-alkenal reductase [Methanococcus vannielii SB]|uniref:2-alkenal reductase n=1 Tax=Methanococcus vannielii (strain ATCC 35089 / DSM 1224 / JCM 13029 / OCM 148 / SB) TaxID=406327 RepID=A6UND5_METVS|nr:Hsp70 family protein [Methanococcus vannielii]ABR54007.1 2-alkenal reductase [Methanococcus vannielii SB]
MSNPIIGIDLGTSTSEIFVFKDGKQMPINDPESDSSVVPSIIAMQNSEIIVGSQAKGLLNSLHELKRKRGTGEKIRFENQEFFAEELEAHILKKLVKNAEDYLGEKISDVVVTVPANFAEPARKATYNIGKLAGLNVLGLINEPTAAALAFGIRNLSSNENIAVFDFGGGTLDISVLEMMGGFLDVKISSGNPKLGGKDIDELIVEYLKKKFLSGNPNSNILNNQQNLLNLKLKAEELKKKLSMVTSSDVYIPNFGGAGKDLELTITRNEFNNAIKPVLDEIRVCIRDALKKANDKGVTQKDISRVLLVGGSSRIPVIQEVVMQEFGTALDKSISPDLAVGIGACIQSAILNGAINPDELMIMDVSPFSLGVECLGIRNGVIIPTEYSSLMPINSPMPYSVTNTYSLLHEEQNAVVIKLFQDPTGIATVTDDEGVIYTGIEGIIENIPKSDNGIPHPVKIDFSYDNNGLITLKATIPTLNNKEIYIEQKITEGLNLQENNPKSVKIPISNGSHGEYTIYVERAEKILNSNEGDEYQRDDLANTLERFKKAWNDSDNSKIIRYSDRLIELLADF